MIFWQSSSRETLLPDVEEFLSEPAGQSLTHFIQQFRELDVTVSVVVPQKHPRLTERQTVNVNLRLFKVNSIFQYNAWKKLILEFAGQ